MAKWAKALLGLAAIGGAAAGVLYYLKKKDACNDDMSADDFEDEDFDLDSDLKPVAEREYVSLKNAVKETVAEVKEEVEEAAGDIAGEAAEIVEDVKEEAKDVIEDMTEK